MPKKTYTAELPKSLVPFAQAYGRKQKRDRNQTLELIQAQTPKSKLNQSPIRRTEPSGSCNFGNRGKR